VRCRFVLVCSMPNTYSQLYVQIVFAVKFRHAVLDPSWSERLHMYITGITQKNGHKMLAINSMPDHLHMLVGWSPGQSISDLMQLVKGDSAEWINKQKWIAGKFHWQTGYGAFTYAGSQVPRVIAYIRNQQIHHRKKSFIEEYRRMLHDAQISFDERYIFHDLRDR
jgi:putative transposase